MHFLNKLIKTFHLFDSLSLSLSLFGKATWRGNYITDIVDQHWDLGQVTLVRNILDREGVEK